MFIRGDVNDDGSYDIGDSIYLLSNLFSLGPDPGCQETADANGDGFKNIADTIYMLSSLFSMGPAPVAPHPDCGTDPDPPGLGCDSYSSCP